MVTLIDIVRRRNEYQCNDHDCDVTACIMYSILSTSGDPNTLESSLSLKENLPHSLVRLAGYTELRHNFYHARGTETANLRKFQPRQHDLQTERNGTHRARTDSPGEYKREIETLFQLILTLTQGSPSSPEDLSAGNGSLHSDTYASF